MQVIRDAELKQKHKEERAARIAAKFGDAPEPEPVYDPEMEEKLERHLRKNVEAFGNGELDNFQAKLDPGMELDAKVDSTVKKWQRKIEHGKKLSFNRQSSLRSNEEERRRAQENQARYYAAETHKKNLIFGEVQEESQEKEEKTQTSDPRRSDQF